MANNHNLIKRTKNHAKGLKGLTNTDYIKLSNVYENEKKKLLLQNNPRFVATFFVYEGENGLFSTCTWTDGVESLLPSHSDYISLVSLETGRSIHFIPMNEFVSKIGLKKDDQHPLYLIADQFPQSFL